MRAAAVVLTLPERIAGASVFGKTIETVLAERPCRVIIESRAAGAGTRAAAREAEGGRMSPLTAALSGAHGRARPGHDRADDRRRRRAARGRDPARAAVRRGRAPAACGRSGADEPARGARRPAARLEAPDALRRGTGSPALFGIVQGFLSASLYFALGVVVANALGLHVARPAGGHAVLRAAVLSYMEGASLHQERGGATVLARYGFNELWSFVAGWAILLDYLILIAITAFGTTDYAALFWGDLAHGAPRAAPRLGGDRLRRVGQHPRRRLAALGAGGVRRLRRPRPSSC